jgi:hypothetical protein
MDMRLKVASPCKESWEKMAGDERVRFCRACHKKVFNLTNLTEREVGELLGSRRELPCVRFFQRADGTVMTADCPVGRRRRWQNRMAGAAAAILFIVGTVRFAGSNPSPAVYPAWFEKILAWFRPAPPQVETWVGEIELIRPTPPSLPPSSSRP